MNREPLTDGDGAERPKLFLHERLLAYKFARFFYQTCREITEQMPRGNSDLADQLIRSARTSLLAIAEGAGSRSWRIKRTYFERATASQGESAACLDQVIDDKAAPAPLVKRARSELESATRLTLGLLRKR